jgi:hypothetical protein
VTDAPGYAYGFITYTCCIFLLGCVMFVRRDRQPIKQRALLLIAGSNIMALAMPWSTSFSNIYGVRIPCVLQLIGITIFVCHFIFTCASLSIDRSMTVVVYRHRVCYFSIPRVHVDYYFYIIGVKHN